MTAFDWFVSKEWEKNRNVNNRLHNISDKPDKRVETSFGSESTNYNFIWIVSCSLIDTRIINFQLNEQKLNKFQQSITQSWCNTHAIVRLCHHFDRFTPGRHDNSDEILFLLFILRIIIYLCTSTDWCHKRQRHRLLTISIPTPILVVHLCQTFRRGRLVYFVPYFFSILLNLRINFHWFGTVMLSLWQMDILSLKEIKNKSDMKPA